MIGPAPESAPLNPLGYTGENFSQSAAGALVFRGLGGRTGALAAYRAMFREGMRETGPARVEIPPIADVRREQSPEGEVVKFLLRLRPNRAADEDALRARAAANSVGTGLGRDVSARFEHLDVESVVVPMIGSSARRTNTLCVSSQVGCAMGCTFCETGQMGLIRSLTPAEIVAQWYAATHVLGREIKNIVFMGMGEPLDNLDAVIRAIDILKDHNGASVPISQITVSTVGRVDGIGRLAEQIRRPGWHRLGIAISLNASNDAVRSSIMPINRAWGMSALRDALLAWPRFAGNKICVEYVLIPGVNDRPEHADELAEYLRPFRTPTRGTPDSPDFGKPRALLNVIPYNPRRDSPWPAPAEGDVDRFIARLIARGVFTKRRRTKGRLMMGACGQLGTESIRRRRLVQPTISA